MPAGGTKMMGRATLAGRCRRPSARPNRTKTRECAANPVHGQKCNFYRYYHDIRHTTESPTHAKGHVTERSRPFGGGFFVALAQQGRDTVESILTSACHRLAAFGKMGRNFSQSVEKVPMAGAKAPQTSPILSVRGETP
jgi:hypothetical protein